MGLRSLGERDFVYIRKKELVPFPSWAEQKRSIGRDAQKLKPDLVVFDKEENNKEMADSCPFPFHATHVSSIQNICSELEILSSLVVSSGLKSLANKWKILADVPDLQFRGWNEIPTLSKRIGTNQETLKKVEYMIWRDPWMTASSQTFIGSVLKKIGLSEYLQASDAKYPTLNPSQTPDASTFYLFSSEPFPFERYMERSRTHWVQRWAC